MRKQFEAMKDGYEKAINKLSERIQAIESRPQPSPNVAVPSPAPAAPAPPAQPAVSQAAPGGAPSLLDLAKPREPFSLYQQRGSGQLLFDMGVTGDFVGNLTQNNVQKATGGTFAGLENLFFPREIELSLFGQIDPYARAEVRFEAGEENRGDITVSLAEAIIAREKGRRS